MTTPEPLTDPASRRTGRVWLVGAGPGDPELITVRGMRLLQSADVVLHDRLVSPALLELIPRGRLRLDVGKLGYAHSISQERISALLVEFARAGYDVVRLKGGDPFVFGRGGEEALALLEAGIAFEVVPGVTAGVAAPALAGIPLTHRGIARSAAFVTAASSTGSEERTGAPDWDALARIDTLVVFMAGAAAPATAAALVAAGRSPETPAAMIVDASLPGQRVIVTTLAALAADPPAVPAQRPCLLVVGEVVALSALLAPGVPSPRDGAATPPDAAAPDAVSAPVPVDAYSAP
ncbi:MAG: uroporphyrin-III C-methyltransferase [Chloroflexota bacterium]|jgi:uroporphyrin-III C-methyltransferase|nr:uroporphyrin-III C-methyltransferase [Chloroflexota bacterium]